MATQKKPLQRAWSCTLRPKTTCPVSSRSFANSTVIRSLCGNLIDSSKLMQLTPGSGGGTKRGHTSLKDHQLETRLAPYHSPRIFGVCVWTNKPLVSCHLSRMSGGSIPGRELCANQIEERSNSVPSSRTVYQNKNKPFVVDDYP